jgi:hypothetical protein
MFGDNQAVVNSSTLLHKQHTLLSYHRVCEAIAAKMIVFIHIDGRINPADIPSKHWGNCQVWGSLQPLLFWSGDTIDTIVRKHGVSFEEEEKGFVEEEKIKMVIDSNGQGVLDFPKPRVTRVGHVLPGLVTSMTGPHDRSSTNASMNESCRSVLPTDPVSDGGLDGSWVQGMENQMHAYAFLIRNSFYWNFRA